MVVEQRWAHLSSGSLLKQREGGGNPLQSAGDVPGEQQLHVSGRSFGGRADVLIAACPQSPRRQALAAEPRGPPKAAALHCRSN
eukprot:351839-Chlamydomonas_euryale.AAC.5